MAKKRDKVAWAAYMRGYTRKNRERLLAQKREAYARDPERYKGYTKQWAEANPERFREIRNNANRKYGASERGKAAAVARQARRRARVNSLEPVNLDLVERLRKEPCTYCNGPGGEIDHIVPISKGGTNADENLAPSCRSCNAAQGDKVMELSTSKDHS